MPWLGFLFGWIPKTIAGAWNWITKSRENTLFTLLVIVIGISFYYRHQAVKALDRIDQIEAAQKKATQDQVTANNVPVVKSKAIAEKSNAEAPAYYRTVATAAGAASVRCETNSSRPSNLPRANTTLEGIHGPNTTPEVVPSPDPNTELVCRPKADDDQLIYGTSRAVKMRQEALELIDQGVATPFVDKPD